MNGPINITDRDINPSITLNTEAFGYACIGKIWKIFHPLRPSHLLTKPRKTLKSG
jgi:hypothetical protein